MNTDEYRRRNPPTGVVCNASVFSLISLDVSDVQQLSFKDMTTFDILPKNIYWRSSRSHIAFLYDICTLHDCYILDLFHRGWV